MQTNHMEEPSQLHSVDSASSSSSSHSSFISDEMTAATYKKEEDALLLQKFKEQVAQYLQEGNFMHKDHFLKKWLTARQNNLEKAVQMFVNSQKFRQRYECDTMLDTYTCPKVVEEYITGGICGFDKDESPVRVELFGNLDMRGLMRTCTKTELERVKLFECECIVKLWETRSAELGRIVDGLTVIFDMENVGSSFLWRPGLEMYLHLIRILEDNYPEMVKRLLVINAPTIFPILYRLCRPLLSEDMKKKIFIVRDCKTTLLEFIDAEELPEYMGGLKTGPDGDPRCTHLIKQGGRIPESMYDLLDSGDSNNGVESFVVPRCGICEREILICSEHSILKWEFTTERFDIAFGLFMLTEDGEKRPLINMQRVNSHFCPERGTFHCLEVGTFLLVFDNTFSWTRRKRVSLRMRVLEPGTAGL